MRSLLVVGLALCSVTAHAQSALDSLEAEARKSMLSPLLLLAPQSVQSGYVLRHLIRSEAFGEFASTHSPELAFDEIYYTSAALCHGDVTTALLAASFGCLEHEYLPIKFLGHEFNVPLTSESHTEFLTRQSHLPGHLYHIAEDDRDKLQHFLAGAWLKSWLGMDCLVALGGELVELFESTFVESSERDPRDIHANDDGAHFATKAARNLSEPPSRSLTKNP